MVSHLRPALVLILLFTLLAGLALPMAMTGIAGVIFPRQAGGSLLLRDGKIVGSARVGQNFASDRYFHPRPSATTDTDPADPTKTVPVRYKADASSASNLAPTSKALLERVQGDIGAAGSKPVPADTVTTSASGLDPHVSPQNAQRQVERVAAARGMEAARVRALVEAATAQPALGFIGQPRVNVLRLNLALDAAGVR